MEIAVKMFWLRFRRFEYPSFESFHASFAILFWILTRFEYLKYFSRLFDLRLPKKSWITECFGFRRWFEILYQKLEKSEFDSKGKIKVVTKTIFMYSRRNVRFPYNGWLNVRRFISFTSVASSVSHVSSAAQKNLWASFSFIGKFSNSNTIKKKLSKAR